MISDLDLHMLYPHYWLLIRNDSDALISAFPTINIATGLNVLESLLSNTIINYAFGSSMWLWHIVVSVCFIRGGDSGLSPGMGDLSS